MPSQRVLILMSNTGAGHLTSAEALRAGFELSFGPRYRIDIVDPLSHHLPQPLRRLPATYPFLTRRTPWLWHALWHVDLLYAEALFKLIAQLGYASIQRMLATYCPDLVVSVHPLMQLLMLPPLQRLMPRVPFATVVTDPATAHPLWFHPAVWRCYVAGEETLIQAGRRGLAPEQLRTFGLPVRPDFAAAARPRPELRQALGLPELPAVLLMGGGEGVGRIATTARATAQALAARDGPRGQLVVICGRNRRLQAALAGETWPVPTQVLGFVKNMAAWMQACDCIITKAGPGTIAEAMICGVPVIINSYIPGQEAGNVRYVVESGVGRHLVQPPAIARQVALWFGEYAGELACMSARARGMARPDATRLIVEDLADFLR